MQLTSCVSLQLKTRQLRGSLCRVKFRSLASSGPGDTVKPEVGDMVPLTNGSDIVSEIDRTLADLAAIGTFLIAYGCKACDAVCIVDVIERLPNPGTPFGRLSCYSKRKELFF
jgi:hypothetical protein